jgi:AcrR family transcriptional regulator
MTISEPGVIQLLAAQRTQRYPERFVCRYGGGVTQPRAPGRRSTGRPRSSEVDARLIEAALGLLREGGPTAVNVEAVAARSGVAKTTIYRRHRDRHDLLRAAIGSVVIPPGQPPVEDIRGRLAWALGQVHAILGEVLGGGGVAALLEDREPAFTTLVRDLLTPYTTTLTELIEDDIAAGRLRRDLDADAAVSMMLGAYLGELLRHGTIGADWIPRCVDLLWHAITRPSTPIGSPPPPARR